MHDLLFASSYQPLWTAVQSIAAVIAACAAIAAAVGTILAFFKIRSQVREAQAQINVMREQTDAMRAAARWDLLLRTEDRFDSDDTRAARGFAAQILKLAATTSPRPADFWKESTRGRRVQDVIDKFETLGLLVKQGAIDEKAVWSTFGYYINNYHFHCAETRWFEEWCGADPTFYADFKWLHARMQEIHREEPDPDFLQEETTFLE